MAVFGRVSDVRLSQVAACARAGDRTTRARAGGSRGGFHFALAFSSSSWYSGYIVLAPPIAASSGKRYRSRNSLTAGFSAHQVMRHDALRPVGDLVHVGYAASSQAPGPNCVRSIKVKFSVLMSGSVRYTGSVTTEMCVRLLP